MIGAGFVGRHLGSVYSSLGHDVIFYDIDGDALRLLERKGFRTTGDIENAIAGTSVSYISVPTPSDKDGKMVNEFISSAAKECGLVLKNKKDAHIFVIKSTVLPGTTEKEIIPLMRKASKKEFDRDFGVIHSPEFITEISHTWTDDSSFEITHQNEGRIVLGESNNKRWGDILIREVYNPLKSPVIRTDYRTAEMIKYVSNCYAATRISYFNEIFLLCEKLGIDSNLVAEVVCMDPRFGKYGVVHGKAFGGKCLPKDLKAFVKFADQHSDMKLLKTVEKINEYMEKKHGVRK